MLRSYLTIAIRNLQKYKFYSLINVLGLAVGLACCILVFLHVRDEFRYASYHSEGGSIYRVLRETRRSGSKANINHGTSGGIKSAMEKDFAEVEYAVRVMYGGCWIRYGEKNLQGWMSLADPEVLEMFDIRLLRGDRATILDAPGKILISARTAEAYFDDEDPMGKIISVDDDKFGGEYTITGVFADPPRHSHVRFEFLFSHPLPQCPKYVSGRSWQGWAPNTAWRPVRNYVKLKDGVDKEALETKLHDFIVRYMGEDVAAKNAYFMQQLDRDYLYGLADYQGGGGPIVQIYLLTLIAVLILVIACVNFVNLATARASVRAKEIGVRKVTGAERGQLMRQFLGESVILTAVSLPIALGLSWISLPTVNEFVHKDLSFGAEPILILLLPAAALIVGLLAGWYPAVFLSSVQPVSVLKGSFTPGSREAWMRKSLVIFQFAASTALIISTTVIYQQTEFMQGRDLGWNKDYLINTPLFFADLSLTKHRERVKDAFLRHPNVLKITAVWPPPGRGGERHVVYPEGEVEGDWEMQIIGIDEDFLDTYEVELVAGRNIDLSTGTDSTQAYILNEAAVKALGWKEPLGKSFAWRQNKGTVIGVVKDFHTKSLHSPIEPVVLFHWIHPTLSIRIRPVEIQETLAFLEKTWKQFIPERPFNYQFQDENMAGRYWQETRQSTIYGTLSLLAIFVACLGLFGLAAFTTERRRKEISIRKSLGASQSTLFLLLSKDLAQSVALSMAIAWPVTYYLMASWLEKFAFRIDLGPGVFLFGGAVGLAIALVTVSWQTIRAATRNPVEVLRHE